MKYKLGDILNYKSYKDVEIIAKGRECYTFKNKDNITKKVSTELIDKHAILVSRKKIKKSKKTGNPWDTRGWDPDPNKDRRNIIG